MKHWIQSALFILLTVAVTILTFPSAEAAPAASPANSQATLTLKATVDQPEIFWKYTFLTKDSDLGKPSAIKLVWSLGQTPSKEKTETIVSSEKSSGEFKIVSERGSLVNIQLSVCDSKNLNLGSINLQIRNNGQTETISFAPPESSEPKINWSNL